MFRDRLKMMVRSEPGRRGPGVEAAARPPGGPAGARPAAEKCFSRQSNGLSQFFEYIHGQAGLSILDLAGASQANIGFITSLGHRIYSEDFLGALDDFFKGGDLFERQSDPERIDAFLAHALNFKDFSFDGALVWDALEYLAPPLLYATVDRLYQILRPGSYLLAFFHTDERAELIPAYRYRIADAKTLLLVPQGIRKPAQLFNNRGLEKLFRQFDSVKFFLTRDHLREVIVRR